MMSRFLGGATFIETKDWKKTDFFAWREIKDKLSFRHTGV